jgi:hypothetical protein
VPAAAIRSAPTAATPWALAAIVSASLASSATGSRWPVPPRDQGADCLGMPAPASEITVTSAYAAAFWAQLLAEVATGCTVHVVDDVESRTEVAVIRPGSGRKVELADLDGIGGREASTLTGLSPAAIRKRRSRARLRQSDAATIAPLSTPPVWSVSVNFAQVHLGELLAFAEDGEDGSAVRVVDGRQPARQFWLGVQPPAWWTPALDDTDLLVAGMSQRRSDTRRATLAQKKGAPVSA